MTHAISAHSTITAPEKSNSQKKALSQTAKSYQYNDNNNSDMVIAHHYDEKGSI